MATTSKPNKRPQGFKISIAFEKLDSELATMIFHLEEHAGRLGVTPEQIGRLTDLQEKWDPAFAAYKNPATHTSITVGTVQKLAKKIESRLRAMRRQIKNSDIVTLNAGDIVNLKIHPDKETRTRVPVPQHTPVIEQFRWNPRNPGFAVSYTVDGTEKKKRMPYKTHLEVKTAYAAGGEPPPGAGAYQTVRESGKMKFGITVPGGIPIGMRGFVKVCFVNSNGEPGADSYPLEFLVN